MINNFTPSMSDDVYNALLLRAAATFHYTDSFTVRVKELECNPMTGENRAGLSYLWINGGSPLYQSQSFKFFLHVDASLFVLQSRGWSPAVTEVTLWECSNEKCALQVNVTNKVNSAGRSYFMGLFQPASGAQGALRFGTARALAEELARKWGLSVVARKPTADVAWVEDIEGGYVQRGF